MLYLPSIADYRHWIASGTFPQSSPNKGTIRGKWGEQQLVIPLLGGARRARHQRLEEMQMSTHGDWPHTHWQAINSAYGALPFFHLTEDYFGPLYANAQGYLLPYLEAFHQAFLKATLLDENLTWLRENPGNIPGEPPVDYYEIPSHISALELLYRRGAETIFYLLPYR